MSKWESSVSSLFVRFGWLVSFYRLRMVMVQGLCHCLDSNRRKRWYPGSTDFFALDAGGERGRFVASLIGGGRLGSEPEHGTDFFAVLPMIRW